LASSLKTGGLLVVRRPLDRERAQNEDGSEKRGDLGAGNLPDEYGYLDAYSSSRTTCSGAQIVEKPNRSAVVATVLTHSGATVGPMPTAKYPISISVLHKQFEASNGSDSFR
jgi:hypothetical protein